MNGEKKLEEVHQYGYYIDVLKTINVNAIWQCHNICIHT